MLEVLEPGLLTTIQDGGRPGLAHLGIRRSGAADARALAAANLLVGQPAAGPALEMTLLGATFRVRQACVVAIAGADMDARVVEEGRPLPPGGSYRLAAGTTLASGGASDGARTYLSLMGGLRVDPVLGSASTDLWAALGGLDGRALRAGDVLTARSSRRGKLEGRRWPRSVASSGIRPLDGPARVGVTTGPHRDRFEGIALEALLGSRWRVSPRSDRVGIRLEGPVPLPASPAAVDGELVSIPMRPGAVQIPPEGRPIVLLVDAPTVGGYPVPVVAVEADLPVLAQLRTGDEVRFAWVDPDEARRRSTAAMAELVAVERGFGDTS